MSHQMRIRFSSAAGAAALALMALAGPAAAAGHPGPVPGVVGGVEPPAASSSIEYLQIGLGALGGIALSGGAVAAAGALRQRRQAQAA